MTGKLFNTNTETVLHHHRVHPPTPFWWAAKVGGGGWGGVEFADLWRKRVGSVFERGGMFDTPMHAMISLLRTLKIFNTGKVLHHFLETFKGFSFEK